MSAALADVLRRRSVLVARSEALRRSLVRQAPVLARPFAWADKVRSIQRWCADRPVLVAGVMAALAALRRRQSISWAMRAWTGWRLWRQLKLQSPWKPPAR